MRLALDYDHTFTLDPEVWYQMIKLFQDRGHEIVCVTARAERTPVEIDPKIPVYYTDLMPKVQFMEEKGISIDVWIDDNPWTLIDDLCKHPRFNHALGHLGPSLDKVADDL